MGTSNGVENRHSSISSPPDTNFPLADGASHSYLCVPYQPHKRVPIVVTSVCALANPPILTVTSQKLAAKRYTQTHKNKTQVNITQKFAIPRLSLAVEQFGAFRDEGGRWEKTENLSARNCTGKVKWREIPTLCSFTSTYSFPHTDTPCSLLSEALSLRVLSSSVPLPPPLERPSTRLFRTV